MGQLVAESLRLYGARFWPSLALGIGPALTGVGLVTLPHPLAWALVPTFGTLLWAAAYVGACRLALVALRQALHRFLPQSHGSWRHAPALHSSRSESRVSA